MIRMNLSTLIPHLLQYQLLLKLYHWQTHSYARHKASDELYDKLTDFMDQLVEYGTYQTRLRVVAQCIKIHNMTDDNAVSFLEDLSNVIENIQTNDQGIRARRDDLIGYLHQTIYLFHLV
jgi:hypothetical protein